MPITGLAGFSAKCRGAAVVALALLCQIALTGTVLPQDTQPPAASPSPESPPVAPQSTGSPGLIDKLGDWLRSSAEGVSSGLKGTQQRIEEINKGTLDTLTSIPVAGFASGRSLCPRSANGAPDCYVATEKLCKEKGYTSGRSLNTEASENCNPRIYLPGYQRKEGDCRIETYVTRAACQ